MAIFLTGESRIMIQGITGSEGSRHGAGCSRPAQSGRRYQPAQGRADHRPGGAAVPVFGTVAEAMAATGADVSVVFVPRRARRTR